MGSLHIVLLPPPPENPPCCDNHQKVDYKKIRQKWGKVMIPTCCRNHWWREGVTLMTAAEHKQTTEEKGIQQIRLQGSF